MTPEDHIKIGQAHERIVLDSDTFLLRKGSVAQAFYVLEQGLVRSYLHNVAGDEVTTGFYCAPDIIIESFSLFQRVPAREHYQALSPGIAWKIEYAVFQQLLREMEGLREWGRNWATSQLLDCKLRAIESQTVTATGRYLKLVEERPDIVRISPLKYIASYLGITDTSLSRIRKEIASL